MINFGRKKMEKKTYTYNFPMPAVTVDCVIFRYNDEIGSPEVLLIKRENEPYKDCWALPGGFMEIDETINDATHREVMEETGIDITTQSFMKKYQMGIFDKPDRDERQRIISILSSCVVSSNVETKAGDDAKECKWFSLNNMPTIAFDHGEMIKKACKVQKIW